MKKSVEKPKQRAAWRMYLGGKYFSMKRHLFWRMSGIDFARVRNEALTYMHATHRTPLLRKLKDVDMYLQYNKITNLKIALPKINHTVLYPGETLSYWRLIGKPSKRKGYQKGMVLLGGGFAEGTGGGLCQLSNLIYWMTLHTPLTVIERHRHGYDVFPDSNRTQPFGSGATCFYNYGDLMIQNNTNQKFELRLQLSEQELIGYWFSDIPPMVQYEVYEKEHEFRPEYWGGYTRHNVLHRRIYDMNDALLDDEFVVENHAITMYPPFLSE